MILALVAAQTLTDALSERYARVLESVRPSVVAIYADRPYRAMGWLSPPPGAPLSGTIVRADGMIVTTAFNVDGIRGAPRVRLADGRELEGRVLAVNTMLDIALIQVAAEGLPTLPAADPGTFHPARPVAAIGIGSDGRSATIHPGFLSAPSRVIGLAVQHDARIHFGNVGGPLVDLEGRLIGVTSRITDETIEQEGVGSGVSYAVAWYALDRQIPGLAAGRSIRGAQLGVYPEDAPESGVRVRDVVPDGPAARAGLRGGDVILRLDGESLESKDEMHYLLWLRNAGDRVRLDVRRDEEEISIEVELGERT